MLRVIGAFEERDLREGRVIVCQCRIVLMPTSVPQPRSLAQTVFTMAFSEHIWPRTLSSPPLRWSALPRYSEIFLLEDESLHVPIRGQVQNRAMARRTIECGKGRTAPIDKTPPPRDENGKPRRIRVAKVSVQKFFDKHWRRGRGRRAHVRFNP